MGVVSDGMDNRLPRPVRPFRLPPQKRERRPGAGSLELSQPIPIQRVFR